MLPFLSIGVKKRTKVKKWKKRILIFIIITFLIILLSFYIVNIRIMPSIIAFANQRLTIEMNNAIDSSLNEIFGNIYNDPFPNISMADFFDYSTDEYGLFLSLSLNTILINQIASFMAVDISRILADEELMRIYVPIGIFAGIAIFAGLGPSIGINIIPSGEAQIQYETQFSSAGINQTNFQVWLNIQASMRVMVPLQESIISTDRRIAIVNTVFAGEVPHGMIFSP
jgi:sporulation protein YunB